MEVSLYSRGEGCGCGSTHVCAAPGLGGARTVVGAAARAEASGRGEGAHVLCIVRRPLAFNSCATRTASTR